MRLSYLIYCQTAKVSKSGLRLAAIRIPVNMPIWGPHGFLVGNWATGLCVGQFTGAQVGLAWA